MTPQDQRRIYTYKRFGSVPQCIGRYEHKHKECDGRPSCSWRTGCRLFQEYCQRKDVEPAVEVKYTDHKVLRYLISKLMVTHKPLAGWTVPKHYVMQGCERFVEALKSELNPIDILPLPDLAMTGECYILPLKRGRKGGFVQAFSIKVRGTKSVDYLGYDPVLTRYFNDSVTRLRPNVEIRCPLEVLLDEFPMVTDWPERWRIYNNGIGDKHTLGATAACVPPERIEDMARLVVEVLRQGLTKGMRLGKRRILFEKKRSLSLK